MAGYVIYNGFWNAKGPSDPVRRLCEAGARCGLPLRAVPNTQAAAEFGPGVAVCGFKPGDFALFWDKDVRLARALEAAGVRLYNSAEAVAVCDDKAATHLALAREEIPMPHTLVAPMTYVSMDEEPSRPFLRRAADTLGFPMVVKECYGSLGGQVYLARDAGELRRLADGMGPRPFLCQQFVRASAGTDFRLYVVGSRVAASMRRVADGDFRANVGNGGRAEPYTPLPEEEALALRCARILGARFAGVDLLRGENGAPLVCEVNSNAHMAAITACTGVDVAAAIVEEVLRCEAARTGATI